MQHRWPLLSCELHLTLCLHENKKPSALLSLSLLILNKIFILELSRIIFFLWSNMIEKSDLSCLFEHRLRLHHVTLHRKHFALAIIWCNNVLMTHFRADFTHEWIKRDWLDLLKVKARFKNLPSTEQNLHLVYQPILFHLKFNHSINGLCRYFGTTHLSQTKTNKAIQTMEMSSWGVF